MLINYRDEEGDDLRIETYYPNSSSFEVTVCDNVDGIERAACKVPPSFLAEALEAVGYTVTPPPPPPPRAPMQGDILRHTQGSGGVYHSYSSTYQILSSETDDTDRYSALRIDTDKRTGKTSKAFAPGKFHGGGYEHTDGRALPTREQRQQQKDNPDNV